MSSCNVMLGGDRVVRGLQRKILNNGAGGTKKRFANDAEKTEKINNIGFGNWEMFLNITQN